MTPPPSLCIVYSWKHVYVCKMAPKSKVTELSNLLIGHVSEVGGYSLDINHCAANYPFYWLETQTIISQGFCQSGIPKLGARVWGQTQSCRLLGAVVPCYVNKS